MMNKRPRILGLITALVLLFAGIVIPGDFNSREVKAGGFKASLAVSVTDTTQQLISATTVAPSNVQDGVTLHCWNWSYKDIEANMALIASQGFTAIQTSPIQQAKEATKGKPMGNWWVYYQPMGFHIDNTGNSALGTKAEFQSMCSTAHSYGIKVIVDVVANHMGNQNSNDLSSAIIPDLRNDSSCWHDITKNTYDYSKRYDITQWCMNGVPDLNTGNAKVQNYVLNFLKECIDAGADGFRFDAAKHIETPDDGADNCASNFWPTVINGAKSYAASKRGIDLYCYGELLDSPGGSLPVSAYTQYMSVTDNSWSNTLRGSIAGGGSISPFYHKADTAASKLVLWAESHDTYANEGSGSVSVQNINKTWAIVAARADAMGLYFCRPANMSSQKLGAGSVTGWAYKEVAAVNRFHNAFVGKSEYISDENRIAYCERGDSGVVLVNCNGANAAVNVTAHVMKEGTYTDQLTGNTFTVSGGRIKGNIGGTGIAVVYNTSDNSGSSSGGNTAYIELPSGWSSKVYCYVYDAATGTVSNGQWPGAAMTNVSGRVYKYTVPDNIKNPMVIFYSSDSCRYPADLEPGLSLTGSMIYQNGEWKNYTEVTYGTVVVQYVDENGKSISESVNLQGVTGTKYSVSQKNISGYNFVKTSGQASGTYTNGTITVKFIYSLSSSGETVSGTTESNIEETPQESDETKESASNGENEETGSEESKESSSESLESESAAADTSANETKSSANEDNKEDNNIEEKTTNKFPWAAVVVPVAVLAVGGTVFVFLRYRNKKEENL